MRIVVDNKPAAVKKDTSFEFVSENRLFSGSDGYSMTMTFPLRGCPQNHRIFGHINRADVAAGRIVFNGSIHDRDFNKFGSFTVTEISDAEVKAQFLEGRSEQNYDSTFDKVYINELDLGEFYEPNKKKITPSQAWHPKETKVGNDYWPVAVCLPWIRKSGSSYDRAVGNIAYWDSDKEEYDWRYADTANGREDDMPALSWQPYLIYIAQKVCDAVGYAYDFTAWVKSQAHRHLLVCNTLPAKWGLYGYARALPHWTVEEFFAQLELLLGGEFDIDHKTRFIGFTFSRDALAAHGEITPENVVDEHTTEVSMADDSKCDYLGEKRIGYKECKHDRWAYYCCPDFISEYNRYFENSADAGDRRPVIAYPDMFALLNAIVDVRNLTWFGYESDSQYTKKRIPEVDAILYVQDIDQYYAFREYARDERKNEDGSYKYITQSFDLLPLNNFGPRVPDNPDADSEELQIVPACVGRITDTTAETSYANILFLEPDNYDTEAERVIRGCRLSDLVRDHGRPWPQQALAKSSEKPDYPEYYDRIYVAWYRGPYDYVSARPNLPYAVPFPHVYDTAVAPDWSSSCELPFSLRLNNRKWLEDYGLVKIEPTQRMTFKFLSRTVPDVRAIYNIRGRKYICEKLTATFTENGMSQLIKGEFYPLADE